MSVSGSNNPMAQAGFTPPQRWALGSYLYLFLSLWFLVLSAWNQMLPFSQPVKILNKLLKVQNFPKPVLLNAIILSLVIILAILVLENPWKTIYRHMIRFQIGEKNKWNNRLNRKDLHRQWKIMTPQWDQMQCQFYQKQLRLQLQQHRLSSKPGLNMNIFHGFKGRACRSDKCKNHKILSKKSFNLFWACWKLLFALLSLWIWYFSISSSEKLSIMRQQKAEWRYIRSS